MYTLKEPTQYIIEDKPLNDLPIRRLQNNGGDALEINELVQIALGKVDGIEPILNEYGANILLSLNSVTEIVETLKIDHLQATRLLAVLSIGKRLYRKAHGSMIYIRSAEDVYLNYRSMASLNQEHLKVLLINSRYQVVHEQIVGIGSLDNLAVSPLEIFQPAAERRIKNIILVHNHPSGDHTPSESDYSFTSKICTAAKLLEITVIDHVIISDNGYSSCLKNNSTE